MEPDRYFQVSVFKPQSELLALVFADITEQKFAEKQLQIVLDRMRRSRQRTLNRLLREITKRRLQKQRLLITDSLFLYSSEGICITDPEGIIEKINPAFTAITGYTARDVLGKKTNILVSSYHSSEFYEDMWHRLKTQGSWSGEIWNRRKNGEVYLEYLAITAVTNAHDKVVHYVALFHNISEIKASKDCELHQSLHDGLTGLPNRLLFVDHCEALVVRSPQQKESLAIILMGVDDFKNINELLGYEVGDLVLQHVATHIVKCCRIQDVVARMGGDQFALLIPEVMENPDDVLRLANRIMRELRKPFSIYDHRIFLKISFGIAIFPDHGITSQLLLQNAEMALYKAKELGKNRIVVYSDKVRDVLRRRVDLLHKMRLALERCEFELYFQPKVSFESCRITGAEALIRWRTEDNEIVSPDEFIPLVEKHDLIIPLGDWVVEEACRWLRIWHDHGYAQLTMAVNLAARQFLDPDLVDKLFSVLERNHLKVHSLHLEITEHTMVEHLSETIGIMERLAQYGFSISIDDFGTGFSSLAYLKQFPITTLKIDRSFIKNLPDDTHDKTIIDLIMSLAKSLEMSVVAEGVETREQFDFLRQLHCEEFQGYLCSRPLSPEDFERFIAENETWGDCSS